MKNATAILFDLDGTLSDPGEGIIKSIRYALEKIGYPCPSDDVLASHIGPPLQLAFASIFGAGHDDKVNEAVQHYRQRYSVEGRGMIENRLYPGMPETLKILQDAGRRLFVATSKPMAITMQIIAHFNLGSFFSGIYGSELDGTRSDKGDLIAFIVEQEKLSPEETIVIGDRKHDIIGASRCGIKSIGACWGYGSAQELNEAGTVALAQTPEDLIGLLLS